MHTALTIAGSDPSGGAGLQADLKTFARLGVYGMAVLTLATVQNTEGVSGVRILEPGFVGEQIDAVLTDIPAGAVKTGALGSAEMIEAVAGRLRHAETPVVVDPVMISKHGHPLLGDDASAVLMQTLLPVAAIVTPNRHEAERLACVPIRARADMLRAARAIAEQTGAAVYLKGTGIDGRAADLLWTGDGADWLDAPLRSTSSVHGTGCVLSAAIAAGLASGRSLPDACADAKRFVTSAVHHAPGLGAGHGPTGIEMASI